MAAIKERAERWIFTKKQLENTPSRKYDINAEKELSYRQQAANLVQDMGQRLQVTQLCINTAIVYMHRFYMFHSFTKFHRNCIAPACLFLAAKVEEQPRKLEHVVGVAHRCLNRDAPGLTPDSEKYLEKAQELVIDENILLQTLGFDITVDHPHTHVVKTCQLVRASKDLAQTSYFLATNSLHLSMMCLTVKPTVVACVAIHLACKWSSWELPRSSEGKDWWWYVEKTVTKEMLEELTAEFLNIIERCPTRLKGKIMTWKSGKREDVYGDAALDQFKDCSSPVASTSKPSPKPEAKPSPHPNLPVRPSPLVKEAGKLAPLPAKEAKARSPAHGDNYKEYKERKERERQQQQLPRKPNGASSDPKARPAAERAEERPRPGQPDYRHRKMTADDRHPARPDMPGHERSRSVEVPTKRPERPGDTRRPETEVRRPDEKRPEVKPKTESGRPGERSHPRPDDRHGRTEERRPESRADPSRPRPERPAHDRRPDPKRHAESSRPKQEEGLRVREYPKTTKLDNLKPLLPQRPERKDETQKEPRQEEPTKADLSFFEDLFGESTSPSDSMDNFVAAIEQELKATEGLNVDTPPGVDYGVDSSILDLMATPPAKIMDRPDFERREEARKDELRWEDLRREETKKEEEKKEDMKRLREENERKERHEKERHEKERHEKERHEKERHEKERHEKERHEKERHEKERHEKERHEKERHDKERHDKEKREKERKANEEREREERKLRSPEASKDSRLSDHRSKLSADEIRSLEEEPSPYKKEKLYPPKERREARPHQKPVVLTPREVTKEFKPVSSTGTIPVHYSDKTPRELKKESKPLGLSSSQPTLSRPDMRREEMRSVTPSLLETRLSDHAEPLLLSLHHDQKPSLKVRLPKPHSSRHSSQSPHPDLEDAPLKVEPLKLKISLSKDREHHKEKKKHRKDEERHRHKHKSKSKSHDHDREHKSRKRAHSPSGGEQVETKMRKHSESNGAPLLSPNMQPVVELQKISDAQIRRSSTSKSPSTSSPLKRPHPQ